MLGVFALAAQKKTGSLHFVLKIVAPGFEITCLPVAEAGTKQLEVFTNIADYIANMRSPTPAGRGSCVLAGGTADGLVDLTKPSAVPNVVEILREDLAGLKHLLDGFRTTTIVQHAARAGVPMSD